MKIKPEDLQTLRDAVEATVKKFPETLAQYKGAGLSHKRYRWDMLYAAKQNDFVCNTLYRYLNDDHIDTALQRILGKDYPA